ncbi:MAG: Gfo/Idh/MocA family oxidoreductase [Kiritimatiellae bacterium]|nr:Gfo/Idh/MocA family oxidoreductase [Kiritimatiellia bacterium]
MNRRDFIKTGAGAFAIAAAGRAFGADAPSNRIRLAVVGCCRSKDHGNGFVLDPKGARGRGYQVMCRACQAQGAEVAAVCDVDKDALEYAAAEVKRLGGNTPKKYRDFRDLMQDPTIDGVIVATPDHSHVYIGCAAMKAGKSLYLEKPIGVTAGEAEVLRDVQKATGAVFQLGTQRRSSYATKQGVELIASGAIGKPHWAKCWCLSDRPAIRGVKPVAIPEWLGKEGWDLWQCCAPRREYRSNIVHYNWRFFRGYGTGDLPNNGLHFVDIARWALGAEWPERVYAGGGHLFCEGEDWDWDDTHMLTVQFPEKKYMTWEGCSHTGAQPFMGLWTGCLVYCDDGVVLFGPRGEAVHYDRKGKKELKRWEAGTADPSAQSGDNRLSNPAEAIDGWHMQRFVECTRNKDLNTAQPIDSSLKSNLLTELGNVSMACGEAIHIDPNTGRPTTKDSPAWKYWTRTYEPGWEVKA